MMVVEMRSRVFPESFSTITPDLRLAPSRVIRMTVEKCEHKIRQNQTVPPGASRQTGNVGSEHDPPKPPRCVPISAKPRRVASLSGFLFIASSSAKMVPRHGEITPREPQERGAIDVIPPAVSHPYPPRLPVLNLYRHAHQRNDPYPMPDPMIRG